MEFSTEDIALKLLANVFDIGDKMGTAYYVVFPLAVSMISFFFIASLFQRQIENVAAEQTKGFGDIVKGLILVMCAMVLYKWIFFAILAFFELLGNSLFSLTDLSNLQQKFVELQTSSTSDDGSVLSRLASIGSRVGQVINGSYSAILITIALLIGSVIEQCLLWIRYIALSLFYVLGPLCICVATWAPARKVATSWFMTVFELGAWFLIMRLIQLSFYGLGMHAVLDGDIPQPIVLTFCVVYIFMMIASFKFTTALFRGESMGMALSAVGAAATAIVTKFGGVGSIAGGAMTALGRAGVGGKAISGALQRMGNVVQGNSSAARKQIDIENIKEALKKR